MNCLMLVDKLLSNHCIDIFYEIRAKTHDSSNRLVPKIVFYAQHEPYICSLKISLSKKILKHYTPNNGEFKAKIRLCSIEIHFYSHF